MIAHNKGNIEVFGYDDVPMGETFTYDGCSVVFYQDTGKGEREKTFHSYFDGNLYRTVSHPPKSQKRFYCCDVYGNYIPRSLLDKLRENRERIKELEKDTFKCTLPTRIKK